MVQKIKAIKEVAPSLYIVARTDARGVEGLDEAIERANAYVKAGADAIFPEALQSEEEFRLFNSKVNAPLLANMTEFGKLHIIVQRNLRIWASKWLFIL